MTGLTLILVAAALGYAGVRWSGLPAIPFLIVVGFGASYLVPLEIDFLSEVLTLGLIILVFVAGIELSPDRTRGYGRATILVGVLQFVILGALGLLAALLLGFGTETAAYVALALTASSTLVVVRLLQERQMLFEPVGRLATGVLLLQDLLVILCIPIVTRLPDGWLEVGIGVLSTFGLMALAGALLRWVAPRVLDRFAFDEETLLLLALSVLFGFLWLASLLDLPMISGAFLAGVVLSGFPVASLVRGQFNSMGDFFHALFFTALGAFLTIPTPVELGQGLLLVLLVVVITPPLVTLLAERAGFSARPAVSTGLLLSQTSEFSLFVALQGLLIGQLAPGVFTVIALVTVLSMMLTPFLARDRVAWALMRLHPFKRTELLSERPRDHVLMLGCGRHGQSLLESLIITRDQVVVVDDDPALVSRLRQAGVTALRGDVSDIEVLWAVGADRAKTVVSTIRRKEDNAPLLALASNVPVLVRGFNEEDGEWIRARGGRPVLYSEAAAQVFREWYESKWEEGVKGKEVTQGT